jgi:hypothetical protein
MRAVVVYRQDGLGNRLLAFGNALRLSRVLGVHCYIAWNEPQRVGNITSYAHLLDMHRLPSNVRLRRIDQGLRELAPSRIGYAGNAEIVDPAALAGTDVLLCVRPQMQRLEREAASPRLAQDFAAALGCLVPVPRLADRARAFAAAAGIRGAVGVHVRRGDLEGHPLERERIRLIGLDRYFAVLDAVAPDSRLFLCTEDGTVIDAFRARYASRVLIYPTRSWNRDDRAATDDALIEMFLLSATRFIVGGPSAFSRFAAARALVPLVVLENRHSVAESIDAATAALQAARRRSAADPTLPG